MFVFTVATGDTATYPPHGIRVALAPTKRSIITEITNYLDEVMAVREERLESVENLLEKHLMDLGSRHIYRNALDDVMGDQPWSLYSDQHGYLI